MSYLYLKGDDFLETSALVVNNVINLFGIIFIVYSITYVFEKMVSFIINAFSDIKIDFGWLSDFKNLGFNLGKKDKKI